jgi:hypothetical protein
MEMQPGTLVVCGTPLFTFTPSKNTRPLHTPIYIPTHPNSLCDKEDNDKRYA